MHRSEQLLAFRLLKISHFHGFDPKMRLKTSKNAAIKLKTLNSAFYDPPTQLRESFRSFTIKFSKLDSLFLHIQPHGPKKSKIAKNQAKPSFSEVETSIFGILVQFYIGVGLLDQVFMNLSSEMRAPIMHFFIVKMTAGPV